ncbi:ABC transporter substrate-binding protein [Nocardioides sp. LHG3406-4]|uniref:ABC transporter substrate-binding protein n=1 Tax=Nocardioides sp. LHG3406-4 TaxID=2804575 RepID=UPI003CE96353
MSASTPRRWLAAGVSVCAMTALTAACSASSPSDNAAEAKKSVKLVNSTPAATGQLDQATWLMSKEPVSLDLDNDGANSQTDLIMSNVCERLNKLGTDLTLGPGLASEYEWTTPTTLVFTLRDDVTFHSGAPMTADDVVWSMERHRNGDSEGDEFVNVTDIEKTGDHEVTFTLGQSDAVFIESLAGDAGVVYERKALEAQGDDFGTPSGKDACSGPFTLDSWSSGEKVVLTKAEDYWDADKAAKTDELTFKWGSDDAIVNSLVTGSAQGAYLENLASATRLSEGGATTVSQGPDTRVWNLMATERGGLTDPNLRKALSLALDRDGINRAAFAGLGQPWKEPVGSGAWGYERSTFETAYDDLAGSPAKPSADDIAEAKKLVEAAGTTKPIVVASDSTPVRNVLANAVVDAAKKIGLEASITQIPTVQYGDYYSSPEVRQEADLFSDDYFISKNDPVGFYKNGASDSEVQWLLNDPAYDQLVKDGRAALDDGERADIAIEMATMWADQMPWIAAIQSPSTVAMSSEVTGVPASGSYRYYPWAADLGTTGE